MSWRECSRCERPTFDAGVAAEIEALVGPGTLDKLDFEAVEVAADEQQVVEPPSVTEPLAPTLYLGMDGTGVPVRKAEVVDCPGKQPDGSAKTREVKLVTVWSAEGRDTDGTPMRDAGSVTYWAAIESAAQKDTEETPSAFAARVEREATRRGFDRAARRAVLGDGALWIWHLADEHFPEAIQIVDRFHAKQHLSDVAKSIYGATSDLAQPWARARHDDEARKCVDYVERNRARLMAAPHLTILTCARRGLGIRLTPSGAGDTRRSCGSGYCGACPGGRRPRRDCRRPWP